MNVSGIIKRHVAEQPEKTAIIFEGRHISYIELDRLITRAADGLLKTGLRRGDVLSLFLPSLPELIIGYLGTVRAGLTVNVVNAMLREQEVAYILNDCRSRAVLVDGSRLPMIEAVKPGLEALEKVIVLGGAEKSDLSFEAILDQGSESFTPAGTRGSDLCHLMYTSGTTGWPKGVMATHLNIWHNATEFGKVHFKPDDITIWWPRRSFIVGDWVNGTFGTLSRGGSVITVERFYPDKALDAIEKLRPTVFQGVPPMYNLLLKQPDLAERDISSVVFCLSGGHQDAGKSDSPDRRYAQVAIRRGLGPDRVFLREAPPHPYTETRIGSCGRGMADAQIKVVDDQGETVPPGEQGELCVKGTCVTKGYLNKPEATAAVFDQDGWFHAGDIAVMDADGYAYIVDRKKDMINVGGEKVFPSEVEDMMLVHPKIKDMVIVGIPDELKGEAPKAFIQLKEGETSSFEEIRAFCKPRMAPYKVPVAVEFVEEIPRSAAGKALRRLLRDKEWEGH